MTTETHRFSRRGATALLFAASFYDFSIQNSLAQTDPLPSWNDGAARKSITDFVAKVTTQGDANFVPPAERIAVFDNDGTLWCEQPIYFQVAYAFDRIKAMAPEHPEWKTTQPFKAILDKDMKAPDAPDEKGLLQIMAATHAGMTTDEFSKAVLDWTSTARHPRFDRPYTELVYQPMLELLTYLRANGFKTFVVSGGGIEFMRPWMEKVYGIPPEQVVGSSGVVAFQIDAAGKPVAFKDSQERVRRRRPGQAGRHQPLYRAAADLRVRQFGRRPAVLQWTSAGEGVRFAGLIHHTDAEREYAYDRQSKVGKLDKALDEASTRNWAVVDMKRTGRTGFCVREVRTER